VKVASHYDVGFVGARLHRLDGARDGAIVGAIRSDFGLRQRQRQDDKDKAIEPQILRTNDDEWTKITHQ
jgi:hypothetical protein